MNEWPELIVPSDVQKQKKQFVLLVFGSDGIAIISITIAYYMIAIVISKLLFQGLNLYFSAILAGLTGAFWGYMIPKDTSFVNRRTREKWFLPEEYFSFVSSVGKKSFWFLFAILIEFILIWFFKIY
jgi:hypothetical protein